MGGETVNRNDVIDVLTAVAAGDRRTVGDADVDVWQAIIGELTKDFALQAVRDHMRDQPGVWLEPGHVYQRARAIRRDQLERTSPPEIEPKHPDEHYPGDAKTVQDPAPYPAGWDAEQRTVAYWYAVTMRAMPHTTAGWEAIAKQLAAAKAKRAES
jgi:hypothetical protein